VDWIDKDAPTAALGYSTTGPTNQDVNVTLVPGETVTVTNNGGIAAYTFAGNGSFIFEFVDLAGNPGSAIATVAWIDKTAPTATVSYSNTGPTNQDVVVTLEPSEVVTVTNNEGSPAYTFADNGSFTFEFVDEAGNTGTMAATVDWIDKIPPTATFSYTTTELTNQDVVVSLVPIEAVTITNNNGNLTYTFIENGSFTFEFVDEVGNTGSATVTVDWIDKIPPTATIGFSTTEPTNSWLHWCPVKPSQSPTTEGAPPTPLRTTAALSLSLLT
jgi:hypothetical protein